jgi:hypothetical protein
MVNVCGWTIDHARDIGNNEIAMYTSHELIAMTGCNDAWRAMAARCQRA